MQLEQLPQFQLVRRAVKQRRQGCGCEECRAIMNQMMSHTMIQLRNQAHAEPSLRDEAAVRAGCIQATIPRTEQERLTALEAENEELKGKLRERRVREPE